MNNAGKRKLSELEESIGYKFSDITLLKQALTHSSAVRYREDSGIDCNERLEFLGDGIFDAIIGEEMYKRLPESPEGVLSKDRALVVCEEGLFEIAKQHSLGSYLVLGKSERGAGERAKESITADAMEAVIGAVYLDGGFECAKELVLELFSDRIDRALAGLIVGDYKSALQEKVQKNGKADIRYRVDKETGPDHDKSFFVSVRVNGKIMGRGKGKSKKEGEQEAAKQALAGGR